MNHPESKFSPVQFLNKGIRQLAARIRFCCIGCSRATKRRAVRAYIVIAAVVRLSWHGLRTCRELNGHLRQRPELSFAELRPCDVMRTAVQMVPLIWNDALTTSSTQIPRARLTQERRSLERMQRRSRKLTTRSGQRLLRATFARAASAAIGQPLPAELVIRLRHDRSLRDLLVTWFDLAMLTSVDPDGQGLLSALSLHAMIPLPDGDRIPEAIVQPLRKLRQGLKYRWEEQVFAAQIDSLRRQLQLISSSLLTVPMVLNELLSKSELPMAMSIENPDI